MCGRVYVKHADVQALVQELLGENAAPEVPPDTGGLNVSPGRSLFILTEGLQGDSPCVPRVARWGLIPAHTKATDDFSYFKQFNARDDNLLLIHADRLNGKRCILPISGFYEWQRRERLPKQPYLVYGDGRPGLYLAGLYEQWMNPDGVQETTFAIVTVDPCAQITWLHDRSPLIMDAAAARRWLDGTQSWTQVQALVKPTPSGLKWHPVTPKVGKIGYREPDCVLPYDLLGGSKTITSYFKPAASPARPETDHDDGDDEVDNASPSKPQPSPGARPSPGAQQRPSASPSPKKKRKIDDFFVKQSSASTENV